MKKFLLIGSVVVVALIALSVAGFAYAQSATPNTPYGPGMMGQWDGNGGIMRGRGGRGGMMGGQEGLLHDYMVKGWAEAFKMPVDELEARLDAGDTMWTVAQEKSITSEQFQTLMVDIRAKAIEQAVADGVITQTQADLMLNHQGGRGGAGGYGSCMGGGGKFGPGFGPGGKQAPQQSETGG